VHPLQEAILAAEELAWDKKMSALRQPATKGPSPGNVPVEQTEEDQEVLRLAVCWPTRAHTHRHTQAHTHTHTHTQVCDTNATRETQGRATGGEGYFGTRLHNGESKASGPEYTDCLRLPGRGVGVGRFHGTQQPHRRQSGARVGH
jgi:hypothetical protein